MLIKRIGAQIFARYIVKKTKKWMERPVDSQGRILIDLVNKGKNTKFGKDHKFNEINNLQQFQNNIPVRNYEALKDYFDQVAAGKPDILWPGKPLYLAKTSGTTSGAKYIPLTRDSMPNHIEAARNAILHYLDETGNYKIVDKKMIFLQGSPVLEEKNGINIGRLSGIVAHFVPSYLQKNRLPSWETNCIEDWEEKIEKITDETEQEDMGIISGIPSWVQTYFERLYERHQQKIGELFPNFDLFIYGGVNYEPYRNKFEDYIGKSVDSIELFPASEGFFAYQDRQDANGMLLLLNAGIFYEFIPVDDYLTGEWKAIGIEDVEKEVNYLLIISSNAGLWRYNIGDTIKFTSLKPYRVIVSGRIKHYTSAFGEHVIASEVEKAIKQASDEHKVSVNEFTVAPQIDPPSGLPYHEWFIEYSVPPKDKEAFARSLDDMMQQQNPYYKDLISGKILRRLVISPIKKGGFQEYMRSQGRLGGQNKVARLANDRKIADKLEKFKKQ